MSNEIKTFEQLALEITELINQNSMHARTIQTQNKLINYHRAKNYSLIRRNRSLIRYNRALFIAVIIMALACLQFILR